jgi:hypothetical protein
MKLLLLCLTFVVFTANNLGAQTCTPGTNFADSTYGVWPSPATNFPAALVSVPYTTDINFKVPSTITADIVAVIPEAALFLGSTIQSFKITNVTGLPAGFLYACNISSCQYNGGSNGCANIYGTTLAPAGSYPVALELDVTVLVSLFPGFPPSPVTQSTAFDGYSIELGNAGTIEQIIAPITVSPNPANNEIKIEGITASMKASQISILNIEGKVVASQQMNGTTNCAFDLTNLHSGIYFASIQYAGGVENIKFILD